MTPKFPQTYVQLSGEDSNAFFIIARVRNALKKDGATKEEIEQFCEEAMSGDYDNVIQTAMRWVAVS